MKAFAIFTIVVAALGMTLGLLMQMGNMAEQAIGATYLGSGFVCVLLGLVVVALTDIREAITKQFQSSATSAS